MARDTEFNAFIDQYKQLIPEKQENDSPQMDSLNVPAPSTAPSSGNLVTCQYCGNVFAVKYNKCPFCNARRSDAL
jgi:rubrerythrin